MFTVAVVGSASRYYREKLVVASDRVVGDPQQLEVCMSILQGKDVLISLPTSYGKTFVYQQLPIAATEILRSCFLL